MAFALTSFVADSMRFAGTVPYRAKQLYVFTITGTTADVTLDLGLSTGTFWTAAVADATYGQLATNVLADIKRLKANYKAVSQIYVPELAARLQAAAASGTSYTLSIDSDLTLPDYTFAANNGATSYTVFVEYLLTPNTLAASIAYNVG